MNIPISSPFCYTECNKQMDGNIQITVKDVSPMGTSDMETDPVHTSKAENPAIR